MSGDIEEFLRRAAQRRQQQGKSRPSQPAAPIQPRAPNPPPPRQTAPLAQVVDAEVIDDEESVSGDDVARSVASHLDTGAFAERASHLGEGVRKEQEQMSAQVQQHLATGKPLAEKKLKATEEAPAAQPADNSAPIAVAVQKTTGPAAVIAAMMRDPKTVRNAVILSEILGRPEERW